ncbi:MULTISPECIES: hypothetical protein [unclassified Haloarcula]|uniref:hypothetical protein n=1 Tax=Haloarcula TaxID=2237 RepID=UPI0012FEB5DB|nr:MULTISPECIES: hypothetical protein [Haloarcula]
MTTHPAVGEIVAITTTDSESLLLVSHCHELHRVDGRVPHHRELLRPVPPR